MNALSQLQIISVPLLFGLDHKNPFIVSAREKEGFIIG